jgi:probable rRNA maturation factor
VSTVEVEVQIAPAFDQELSADSLSALAQEILRQEEATGQVTLVVTDDQGIRELNRDFVGVDAPTDVLAFSAQEGDSSFVVSPEGQQYLGDVIISYPRALAQASEMGHSLELELHLLIVHGLLHLLGYDHAGEEEKSVMWARQDEILHSL